MKMSRNPQTIATLFGIIAAALVVAGIYFGSGGLTRFDTPLAAYAAATVIAAFGLVYRYVMWVQRPPTWKYFMASLRLFLRPQKLIGNVLHLIGLTMRNIVAQKFVLNRGKGRWAAHMCLAWGCLLAFAITFPLSWGWVQFTIAGRRQELCNGVYGNPAIRVRSEWRSWLFHAEWAQHQRCSRSGGRRHGDA